ncbi:DUF72 domain-containing protein [Sanguibacter sp. 25GB23B1]|uniref:DUF72 domain-containing protein n=1 Tax=unclassified Sanguibacter TaxID=2645534 RepID=UPI0032AEB2E9
MTRAAPAAQVRVGISGWRYTPWRGTFYPKGLVQRRELAYVGERLSTLEINGTFYALQTPASFERWRDEVPEDFVFSVKGPRYITHLLRLRNARQALANFFASGVLALGPRLGPLLWQLPARETFDADTLDAFLALLPRTTTEAAELAQDRDERMTDREWLTTDAHRPLHHALEVRHDSFTTPEAIDLVRRHGVALVVADTAGKWPEVRELTADFVYVRLHGASELYVSGYSEDDLDTWAARCAAWRDGSAAEPARDVFVYFDNDVKVRAPVDAMRLAQILGLDTGRRPLV